MADKWAIDEDYPEGHLVPMTPAEEAQHAADQVAGAAAAETEASQAAALAERLELLEQARADLASGAIFPSLSAAERRVLDALLAGARAVRA